MDSFVRKEMKNLNEPEMNSAQRWLAAVTSFMVTKKKWGVDKDKSAEVDGAKDVHLGVGA